MHTVCIGDDANAPWGRRQLLCRRSRKGDVFQAIYKRIKPALQGGLLCWVPSLLRGFRLVPQSGSLKWSEYTDYHTLFLGLFGIAASVQPDFASSIGNVIAYQLDTLTRPMRGGVTQTELSRAKNQLKSSLVMALESRSVEVEGE